MARIQAQMGDLKTARIHIYAAQRMLKDRGAPTLVECDTLTRLCLFWSVGARDMYLHSTNLQIVGSRLLRAASQMCLRAYHCPRDI
jgi:hypothetical protein